MLELKNIVKKYRVGEGTVTALKGVSLDLRDSEFVAVLGPSGCGKTTFLNIVGGLDSYTSGDLIINGISTKDYRDSDWDAYRNHRVGFVFQSYNLIPHQDALSNVELSLQISGISKSERRERAKQALIKVGLADQLHKKPNMMSGGQMQRVAIARALVNEPDIILADEPTGALDSETSVQIMEILKEVASDRLVIMVTHNPELADTYATRIVRLKDGPVTHDTNPLSPEELSSSQGKERSRRTRLGFGAALSLSLNNLLTKKGRTILTSFAGAIGIIGIALILALSNGMNDFISSIESETMGSYPIELQKETIDLGGMMNEGGAPSAMALSGSGLGEDEDVATEGILSNNIVASSIVSSQSLTALNDLGKFKVFLEDNADTAEDNLAAVEYGYDISPQVYRLNTTADGEDEALLVSPATLDSASTQDQGTGSMGEAMSSMSGMGGMEGMSGMGSFSDSSPLGGSVSSTWEQLVNDQTLRESHYELLEGTWPTEAGEVALVVSGDNEVSDYVLYTLGLMDINQMNTMIDSINNDEDFDDPQESFAYSDVIGLEFQVLAPYELYEKSSDGDVWIDRSRDQEYLKGLLGDGTTVTITGVLRSGDGAEIASGIVYTGALTEYLMDATAASDIVQDQAADPDTNVLTGKAFAGDDPADSPNGDASDEGTSGASADERADAPEDYSGAVDVSGYDASMYDASPYEDYDASGSTDTSTLSLTEDQLAVLLAQASDTTPATYEEVMEALGYVSVDQPASISLYPVDFDGKTAIEQLIDDYNNQVEDDADRVTYTDMIGILTSSITTIVDTISTILIAFVAISLVVSSIMIAIITYISVLERTKEIGVLRAIGSSKSDITKIFTAETFIEGLVSGVSAILIALLLCIPINILIESFVGVANIAVLPLEYSLVLIAISVLLTLIAGFIPSRMAAKKDPVVALRTE